MRLGAVPLRLLFVLALSFLSCAPVWARARARKSPKTILPPREAVQPPQSARPSTGSLWKGDPQYLYLFADLRARWPGDLVVIRIVENVSATQQADAALNRDVDAAVGISSLFGLQSRLPSSIDLSGGVTATGQTKFNGQGSTSRQAVLTATISATVREVLPSGNLLIEATRQIQVNDEREVLTLRGVIRPEDVGPANVVLSTAVADLELRYGGKGVVGQNLKPSFLFRLLRYIF